MPLSINYDSPKELRAFLEERGIGMRKKFGQNFLIDRNARLRLLNALEIDNGNMVWEIGPGLGAMTGEILLRGAELCAFEIDRAFSAILRELYGANRRFTLIEGDVFKTWPANDSPRVNDEEIYLLGNLPYNIAAALLADFIEKGRFFKRMVITVQKEVAQRICAKCGTPNYSSFSVLCSSVYEARSLFDIKGSCFYPSPRVDSQGIRLDLLQPPKVLPRLFYPMVRSLFSARRKTLRNTLSAFASSVIIKGEVFLGEVKAPINTIRNAAFAGDAAEEALRRAGISGECRAEKLNKDEFSALASILEDIVCNAAQYRRQD